MLCSFDEVYQGVYKVTRCVVGGAHIADGCYREAGDADSLSDGNPSFQQFTSDTSREATPDILKRSSLRPLCRVTGADLSRVNKSGHKPGHPDPFPCGVPNSKANGCL